MQYEIKAKFISLHTYIGSIRTAAAVKPDAQKTNAFQSNKNVLLSKEATVNTKPQLEIFAEEAQKDPTFSSFITDCSLLVPKPLLDLWISNHFMGQLIEMNPSYKKAAGKVIERRTDPQEARRVQLLTLREFDEEYFGFARNPVFTK